MTATTVPAAEQAWPLPMDLMGVAGGIAGIGGALFVVIMAMTPLRGKRTDDPDELAVGAVLPV